jgi:hypothetical protein
MTTTKTISPTIVAGRRHHPKIKPPLSSENNNDGDEIEDYNG